MVHSDGPADEPHYEVRTGVHGEKMCTGNIICIYIRENQEGREG